MTSRNVLTELLNRLSAKHGEAVIVGNDELETWPIDAVATLKAARLLVQAEPAFRITCPGCDRHCFKPVEVVPAEDNRSAQIFIVCNEPEDFGPIRLEPNALERWQLTGELLADALARVLDLVSLKPDCTGTRWSLGFLKGSRRTVELTLAIEDVASLLVAGHTVPVAVVITLDGNVLSVDTAELRKLVDNPRRSESPQERRKRLRQRVAELEAQGVKDFLQQAAREERISVPRLKQLLGPSSQKATASLKRKKHLRR